MAQSIASKTSGRLLSLDVFRGATIAGMMMVNNPGAWAYIYPPFRHAAWNGWTFTDLIFPFFLWIDGMAMTFSFSKRVVQVADRKKLDLHTLLRALIIFAIGLFEPSSTLFGVTDGPGGHAKQQEETKIGIESSIALLIILLP